MLYRIAGIFFVYVVVASARLQADDTPLVLNFANDNPNYNLNDVYVTFFVKGSPSSFQATLDGSAITLSPGSAAPDGKYDTTGFNISQSYSLAQLADGVDVTSATSVRMYITLGQPLATGIGSTTPGSGVLTFGLPSSLGGTADPNWNTRWDFAEVTYNGNPGDSGDIQSINQYGIPLQIQSFTSGSTTPVQTVKTIDNDGDSSVVSQLEALATQNEANALNAAKIPGVPANWSITGPSGFLRIAAPASGPVATTAPSPSVIGPYPSFNTYADYVGTNNSTTPLTGTVGVPGNKFITYTFTAGAAPQDGNYAIVLTGTVSETGTTNSHTFKIVLPPDSNVGTATANYSLSNAIYGAAYIDNPDVQYYIDGGSVTKAAFLAAMGNSSADDGTTAMNQVFHDLASGYNFGLIGNNQKIKLPDGSDLSLNDMGSAGWREIQAMLTNGQISLSDLDLFSLTDSSGDKLYNQWAAILYGSSPSTYGFAYSDFLQPVAINSDEFDNKPINSWTVTVMPDSLDDEQSIPEPGTWSLISFGLLILGWQLRGHVSRTRRQP